ncbi:hypothetical protein JHK86_000537 [Glycine max]|nr:hypothetical protein JHK86_000537 [Glycine max]
MFGISVTEVHREKENVLERLGIGNASFCRHTGKKRVDESKTLTLDGIRNSLIRQEDSIIVSLLERAKYSYNADAYDKDAFFMDGFNGSLVEYMVLQTEKLHSQVGRYKSPDEHAFFPECLPEPVLPPLQYPQVLEFYLLSLDKNSFGEKQVLHHCADSININNKIWNMYLKDLLPRLVKAGDDDNCGSVAVCDTLCLQVKEHGCLFFVTFLAHLLRGWSSGARVLPITGHKFVLSLISLERGKYNYLYKFSLSLGAFSALNSVQIPSFRYNASAPLQALSKRIHYGKFVAEAKFQDAPSEYVAAIEAKDRKLLLDLLTYETVEELVKKRVEIKARQYGQVVKIGETGDIATPVYKIKPSLIANLYGYWVMPLTKEVQVEYLLRRLD